ncbi:MAG: hypothetical protein KC656_14450, partial [Myxococcales bacterium]|nr:hypothetical protein [Myxococcales bacterium]
MAWIRREDHWWAVDLAAGRVLWSEVADWQAVLYAGSVLVRWHGRVVEVRDVYGVRWMKAGRGQGASDRWVVVEADGVQRAYDTTTGEPVFDIPAGGFLIVGDEIGQHDEDADVVRAWDRDGCPLWERELGEDAYLTSTCQGRIVVLESLPGHRTRIRGALELELDGSVYHVVGTDHGWMTCSVLTDGRHVLEVGGPRARRQEHPMPWSAVADGGSLVGWAGRELLWCATTCSTWSTPGRLQLVHLWDGLPWVQVEGLGLGPLCAEAVPPLDLLGVGHTTPLLCTQASPLPPRIRDRGLAQAIDAAGHPIEPALAEYLARLGTDGPWHDELPAVRFEATDTGGVPNVVGDPCLHALGRLGSDLYLLGVYPPDPRHPVLRWDALTETVSWVADDFGDFLRLLDGDEVACHPAAWFLAAHTGPELDTREILAMDDPLRMERAFVRSGDGWLVADLHAVLGWTEGEPHRAALIPWSSRIASLRGALDALDVSTDAVRRWLDRVEGDADLRRRLVLAGVQLEQVLEPDPRWLPLLSLDVGGAFVSLAPHDGRLCVVHWEDGWTRWADAGT